MEVGRKISKREAIKICMEIINNAEQERDDIDRHGGVVGHAQEYFDEANRIFGQMATAREVLQKSPLGRPIPMAGSNPVRAKRKGG